VKPWVRIPLTDCSRFVPINLPLSSGRADPPLTPPRRGTEARARAIDVPLRGGVRGGLSERRFTGSRLGLPTTHWDHEPKGPAEVAPAFGVRATCRRCGTSDSGSKLPHSKRSATENASARGITPGYLRLGSWRAALDFRPRMGTMNRMVRRRSRQRLECARLVAAVGGPIAEASFRTPNAPRLRMSLPGVLHRGICGLGSWKASTSKIGRASGP